MASLHLAETSQAGAEQNLPPGTRLGVPYISALGESCYEILSGSAPSIPGQALCLRHGGWKLLSPIYMSMPTPGTQAEKRP